MMITYSFSPFPVLETERLILRKLEITDAHEILALRSDDRVNEFIDRKKMQSIDEAQNFIYKMSAGIANNEWIFWAIIKKGTGEFVGTVCLWNIVKEEAKAELGYELIHKEQGKGYMSAVVDRVLKYGFITMKLSKIEAVIMKGNANSIKLIEKKGFKQTKEEKGILIYTLAK
jgi:ribosomal-protein-alanine N-acetyltransferase